MITASIITIGDEILVGQTVDTNSTWIATELNKLGIKVVEIISISDDEQKITEALDRELAQSILVFITGGLGPTQDDITKRTLTSYFGDQLLMNEAILKKVEAMFAHINRPMLEVNRQQAMLPAKATIIENDLGTASGMWFEKNKQSVFSLPGVPFEMKGLLKKVIPELKKRYPVAEFYHRTILFQGIGESRLADEISQLETHCRQNDISLAYLPSPGLVKLRFTGTTEKAAPIEKALIQLQQQFPNEVYGFESDTLESVVGELLMSSSKTLSTVESCTGGSVAARILSVAGASAYFRGGIVAYSNEIKVSQVGVSPKTLTEFGAVSQQTVEEMASNGRKIVGSDFCIATSGIAGPDGGTPEKPVGTTWIAVAYEGGVISHKHLFPYNRKRNIELTQVYALNLLRKTLISN